MFDAADVRIWSCLTVTMLDRHVVRAAGRNRPAARRDDGGRAMPALQRTGPALGRAPLSCGICRLPARVPAGPAAVASAAWLSARRRRLVGSRIAISAGGLQSRRLRGQAVTSSAAALPDDAAPPTELATCCCARPPARRRPGWFPQRLA